MATDSETWYELLDQIVYREGLSRPQIARRSGVSTKTIASWLRGDVKRPRRWQPIARVLQALNATTEEADLILQKAGYRPAAEMMGSARDEEERNLLAGWLAPSAPFMAPDMPVARLVGRDGEFQGALRTLAESRRLAIWGMGGVGKTTLAIALAHELKGKFRDGVYWGDIRTSSPEAVLESWCQVCGVDLSRMTDFNSRATHMRGIFSQQQALIILDDVVDSRMALQMIPSQFSDCAVIVTTRSAEVAQNITHRAADQIVPLTPMLRQESIKIFETILGDADLKADPEAADEVAALLGDLPLALQIAGALCADSSLGLRNLAALLDDLKDRLEWLRQDQKPVVRLAFEQSWERLGENMRGALQALAVFEGRLFTTAAFAAAAAIDEVQGMFMLARLARLSLLTAVQDDGYQQHTLLAAYSLEKLGEDRDTWLRFSGHYLDLLQESAFQKETFMEEPDNFMAAMHAAQRLEAWPVVLAFNEILQPIWRQQGLYTLTREGSAWALQAAEAEGERQAEAEIQYRWGEANLEQSSYDEAEQHLLQALALYEEFEDHRRSGDVYIHLSRLGEEQDDFAGAETAVRAAWQSYQQDEDLRGMGRAMHNLAYIYYGQGDYERTIDELDKNAIPTQRTAQDYVGWFRSASLGTTASLQLNQVDAANAYLSTAEELLEHVDNQDEESLFYYTYANLCRFQGEFETAHEYALKALAIFRNMQDIHSQANTYNLLTAIEVFWNDAQPQRQQFDEGFEYCRQGLELSELIDYTIGKGMLLLLKGRLLAQRGDVQEACTAWRRSQELAVVLDHQWLQDRLRQLLAEQECPPITQSPPQ